MLSTELCYIGESHASHRVVLNGRDMLGTELYKMRETCFALCYMGKRHALRRAVLNGRDMLGTELYEMGETCLAQSYVKWERHSWHRAV